MLVTLFKARLWKEFCLPVSKCCWREMLSICLRSPPLETWFPVNYCERWFVEQHARRTRWTHASSARHFRANLIINSRGQRNFSTLFMLVWLTRAFFSKQTASNANFCHISVILEVSRDPFVQSNATKLLAPGRKEIRKSGNETEESVHNCNIFKVFWASYSQATHWFYFCFKQQPWV